MRIAFVSSSSYLDSGAELRMLELAADASERGDDVVLLSAADGSLYAPWFEKHSVRFPVHRVLCIRPPRTQLRRRLPVTVWWQLVGFVRTTLFVRRNKIDVVHVNELLDALLLVAARLGGAATVCFVRVIFERPRLIRRILVSLALIFADRIVCVSEAVRVHMFPRSDRKVRVEHDPAPEVFEGSPSAVDLPRDGFVICSVGKISPNKGQRVIVQALDRLHRSGHRDVHAVLVGSAREGYEKHERELDQLIASNGLGQAINRIDYVSNVFDVLCACDVFVHVPIHHDPFPGVVLEAMSAAKAVVAARSGGIPEQIEHGVTGVLVPRNDPDALAEALVQLKDDPALRARLGEAARASLGGRFSRDRYMKRMAETYGELARAHR